MLIKAFAAILFGIPLFESVSEFGGPEFMNPIMEYLSEIRNTSGLESLNCRGRCHECPLEAVNAAARGDPKYRPAALQLFAESKIQAQHHDQFLPIGFAILAAHRTCCGLITMAEYFCATIRDPYNTVSRKQFEALYLEIYGWTQILRREYTNLCEKELTLHPNPQLYEQTDACPEIPFLTGDFCDAVKKN